MMIQTRSVIRSTALLSLVLLLVACQGGATMSEARPLRWNR